uniref:Autophagy-related protein 2 n=1 Tax=Timema cristinae TaxID=61476 RepID=A0A7R9H5Z6_TIMCR|nr:unnamed protein product [Timema cristinae]
MYDDYGYQHLISLRQVLSATETTRSENTVPFSTSSTHPRQYHKRLVSSTPNCIKPMLLPIVVKAVHVRPDPKLKVQECCLKVSLLPLRLNIDQDSFIFLFNFFSEVSGGSIDEEELSGPCPNSRHTTPTHTAPVMTVNVGTDFASPSLEPQDLLIQLEEEEVIHRSANLRPTESQEDKPPPPPIFFRSFIFTPEVPIRLDYQGKHVDMTHGPFAGLLMGLGQLNCSELRLKRISYRHGQPCIFPSHLHRRFTLPLHCRSGPQSMLSEPSVTTKPLLTAPALPIGSRDGHCL